LNIHLGVTDKARLRNHLIDANPPDYFALIRSVAVYLNSQGYKSKSLEEFFKIGEKQEKYWGKVWSQPGFKEKAERDRIEGEKLLKKLGFI